MNSINLVGNICNDLELKQTSGGKSVTSFNLAVKRPYVANVTDFIPVVLWEKQAEFICQYGKKGSRVGISGKLTSRQYTDSHSNHRTAYEVVGDIIELLTDKNATESKNEASSYIPNAYANNAPKVEDFPDDNLPF